MSVPLLSNCASSISLSRFSLFRFTLPQNPPSPAMENVCTDEECLGKMEIACLKTLACGCPCGGIRDELECLPCLRHDLEEDISEELCAICYVDELQQAPCIQMTGKCRHFFHQECVMEKLQARWPGARIGFEFRCCPVDKHDLMHPSLASVLPDIMKLQRRVNLMALERLHFEQKHKDACLSTQGDDFYGQPLQYALHEFLFYLCYECQRPYFAGGYQCQEADAPFDPKELICPACQPHSVDDCPVHGKDWLAFKCRFCCNIGQWLCWSNTHFCVSVHPGCAFVSGSRNPLQSDVSLFPFFRCIWDRINATRVVHGRSS